MEVDRHGSPPADQDGLVHQAWAHQDGQAAVLDGQAVVDHLVGNQAVVPVAAGNPVEVVVDGNRAEVVTVGGKLFLSNHLSKFGQSHILYFSLVD